MVSFVFWFRVFMNVCWWFVLLLWRCVGWIRCGCVRWCWCIGFVFIIWVRNWCVGVIWWWVIIIIILILVLCFMVWFRLISGGWWYWWMRCIIWWSVVGGCILLNLIRVIFLVCVKLFWRF